MIIIFTIYFRILAKKRGFLSLIKINDNETAFHGFPSNSAKYFANFVLRGKQMHNKVSFNIFH